MTRPSWPFHVNVGSPEYTGLVAWCPYPQGSTAVVHDLVGGSDLALVNGAGPVSTPNGTALDGNANDRGARVTAPSYVKGLNPITLVWIGTGLAANPTGYAVIYGVCYDNTGASPYQMAAISWNTDGTKLSGLFTNASAGFREFTTSSTVTFDTGLHMVVLAIQNNDQRIFLDGALGVAAVGDTFNGGSSTATSVWSIGNGTDLTRNNTIGTYDVRMYSRAWSLSDAQAAWNSGAPWGLYAVGKGRSAFGARKHRPGRTKR